MTKGRDEDLMVPLFDVAQMEAEAARQQPLPSGGRQLGRGRLCRESQAGGGPAAILGVAAVPLTGILAVSWAMEDVKEHQRATVTEDAKVSWSISASGHTASEDDERELAHRISQVLSDPKYGASNATFHGNYVHGDPRTTAGWLKEPPYTEEPGGVADTPGGPRAGY